MNILWLNEDSRTTGFSFKTAYDSFLLSIKENADISDYNILTRSLSDKTALRRAAEADVVLSNIAENPGGGPILSLLETLGIKVISSYDFPNTSAFLEYARDYCVNRKYVEHYRRHFAQKRIIVAGAGTCSAKLTRSDFYDDIAYFVDDDPEKVGSALYGKDVAPFEKLLTEDKDSVFIVINATYANGQKIARRLEGLGFEPKLNYRTIEDYLSITDREELIYHSFDYLEANGFISISTNEYLWNDRAELAAQFLDSTSRSAVDFGCGRQQMRNYLPDGIRYVGVDYVCRTEDTIVCDINSDKLPDVQADTAFCLGFIGYLHNPDAFFEYLHKQGIKQLVMSYHPVELRIGWGYKQSESRGFVNYYSSPELIAAVQNHGFKLSRSKQCYFARSQIIYDFTRV